MTTVDSLQTRIDRLVAEVVSLRVALEESVKLQSHYADLLNMHDGGQRKQFPDGAAWIRRLQGTRPKTIHSERSGSWSRKGKAR